MFLKKKETIIKLFMMVLIGIKETIQDSAIGTKSRFVGHLFLKQAKNRVSD